MLISVDCVYGSWGSWSQCSQSCGDGGTRTSYRPKQRQAAHGGRQCSGPSTRSEPCNRKCCPVDCKWGEWSEYDRCSASCGGGGQVRRREVVEAEVCGGKCEEKAEEMRPCNFNCCPRDCKIGEWQNWGGLIHVSLTFLFIFNKI